MSTTVLSHMGNLFNTVSSRLGKVNGQIQMGQLQIGEIVGKPPIRKGTMTAFSTALINGCLSISMRCCPRNFSRSQADDLLESFVARLEDHGISDVDRGTDEQIG